MATYRKSGRRDPYYCLAGSALAEGDIVQTTEATGSQTVDNAASNAAVFGLTIAAISSGASGMVDRLSPGDLVDTLIVSGTMDNTYKGKYADISDETGITLTNSNNDFRIQGWDGVTTNRCRGWFTTLESATPTVAI